jgi:hypothetical protein
MPATLEGVRSNDTGHEFVGRHHMLHVLKGFFLVFWQNAVVNVVLNRCQDAISFGAALHNLPDKIRQCDPRLHDFVKWTY